MPAAAADLHVAPGRWDSPCSPEDPCGLQHANNVAQPGDRVWIAPGSYWDFIEPEHSGLPDARITYLGVESDTAAVRVGGILLTRNHVTVKWVSLQAGRSATIAWEPEYAATSGNVSGLRDSIHRCSIGQLALFGAKHSVVSGCLVNGPVAIKANGGSTGFRPAQCVPDSVVTANAGADTITGCRIDLGAIRPGDRRFHVAGFAQRCLVERNHLTGTFLGGGDESAIALEIQSASHNVFRRNRWVLEAADSSLDERQFRAVTLRDSARFNRFERDTVLAGLASPPGAGQIHYFLGQSGNECWPWGDATGRNRWNACYLKLTGAVQQQIDLLVDTLTNNVIVSRGTRALEIGRFRSLQLMHNTLFAVQEGVGLGRVGALNLANAPADAASGGVTANRIDSNIFYSGSAHGCDGTWSGSSAVHTTRVQDGFLRDRNLYFSPSGSPQAAYADDGGNCLTVEQVCSQLGDDCQSAWGDPLFANAAFEDFDPRLLAGSAAIGLGWATANAGADLTPPSDVASLAVVPGRTTARLSWNASGDDGAWGSASAYDVRISRTPIDVAGFEQADRVATVLAGAFGAPGCATAHGLLPCTTYHVAVRAEDDALLPSAGVTSVEFTTACGGGEAECPAGPPPPPGPVGVSDPGPADAPRLWMDARDVRFTIPPALAGAPVRLALIDLAGRAVRTLASGPATAGAHRVALDGAAPALRPGIYFLDLRVGGRQLVRKIAHVR